MPLNVEDHDQFYKPGVDDDFSGMFKVHGHSTSDVGLHLPDTPACFRRMADKRARLQKRRHVTHPTPHIPPWVHSMSADGGHPRLSRDLSALLGSRICHDLISPLGAIGNGVELLSMSGISAAAEISLISESVEHANGRIRFFRIAFGSAAPGHLVPRSEVLEILSLLGKGGRLSFTWEPQGELARTRVKLAFLLIQCLESAMPFGGEITIAQMGDTWQLSGKADRMRIEPELWELLTSSEMDTDVSPADVHFALVPVAAEAAERVVTTDIRDGEIKILC